LWSSNSSFHSRLLKASAWSHRTDLSTLNHWFFHLTLFIISLFLHSLNKENALPKIPQILCATLNFSFLYFTWLHQTIFYYCYQIFLILFCISYLTYFNVNSCMPAFKILRTNYWDLLSLWFNNAKKNIWKSYNFNTWYQSLSLFTCENFRVVINFQKHKNKNQNIKLNIAIIIKVFTTNRWCVASFMSSKIRVKVEIIFILHVLFFPFFL